MEKNNIDEEWWTVKRNCYVVTVIVVYDGDPCGTCTIWDTEEEAWRDIEGRIEDWKMNETHYPFIYEKVDDGYLIKESDGRVIRAYKIFDGQELE